MTLWQFMIVTLAVYRLSRIATMEDGPFDVFAKLRGRIDLQQRTWIGRGLNCMLCVSFWMTGAAALLIHATWIEWLAMAGAITVYREVLAR
jgi:hypothetical protein